MTEKVALITGGASGIGRAVARKLAERGARLLIADVDQDGGTAVAEEVGGRFVLTDVTDFEANKAAVGAAVDAYGGLDFAFLNAGVSTGMTLGEEFDVERYRRVMGINLDGVVDGAHAALAALRARGGGDIIATASLAGLTAVPFDPIYGANKHAVVGLVRGLGPVYEGEGVRVNAICPGFADTKILGDMRSQLEAAGLEVLTAETVADGVLSILDAKVTGTCWYVQPGRPAEPFGFRGVPGPR